MGRDGQIALFASLLGQVLDEPDPEQLELARTLLCLPSCPLRQTEIVPPAGRGLAGERTWRSWGESIHAAGLATEPLGRYVRSLRRLPRRYWRSPLGEFLSQSFHDLRRRPWWGKTKLELLRETLFDLATTLGTTLGTTQVAGSADSTELERDRSDTLLFPAKASSHTFVADEVGGGVSWGSLPVIRARVARLYFLEQRVMAMWETRRSLEEKTLRQELVPLLLDQLELDAGSRARRLLAHRLLPSGGSRTRDRHAAQLHITRARYYQLLQESRAALRLRWPEGAWLFRIWAHRVSQRPDGAPCEQLLRWIADDLFGSPEDVES